MSRRPHAHAALVPALALALLGGGATMPAGATPPTEVAGATAAVSAAPPTVSYRMRTQDFEYGLEIDVRGSGAVAGTQAGDDGIWVGLGPSGGLPENVAEGPDPSFFLDSWPVDSSSLEATGGTFSVYFTAPTSRLEMYGDYSLYTWQAPDHSNPSQDSETPLDLDWEAISQNVTMTPWSHGAMHYGEDDWVSVDVRDAPGSSVTLTGLGPARTVGVWESNASFRVPTTLQPGAYTATFRLTTVDGVGEGMTATLPYRVLPGLTSVGTSFVRQPTPRHTGLLRVGAIDRSTAVGPPRGPAAVKVYRGSQVVAYLPQQQLAADGTTVFRLPRLARGSYRVVVGYGGSSLFAASTVTRALTVR